MSARNPTVKDFFKQDVIVWLRSEKYVKHYDEQGQIPQAENGKITAHDTSGIVLNGRQFYPWTRIVKITKAEP